MIPVVTPAEMAAIDAAAPEPVAVLIERAGRAVARSARRLLGGVYGRRVVVVAGGGNNGADGRVAARVLDQAGVRVVVIDATSAPAVLPAADLVIDAAYGTGLSRAYLAPALAQPAPVLAVDIASGVDGSTGVLLGEPLAASATVTFAALKPGLIFEPGAGSCGTIEVADIGLDVGSPLCHVVEPADMTAWLPDRPVDSHKWRTACLVVAGSPGMTGAGALTAGAAMRAGAGYVMWCSPGTESDVGPIEAVRSADLEAVELGRFAAAVVGPGLGRGTSAQSAVADLVASFPGPLVIDGDGLTLLGDPDRLRSRSAATILTPHDGEFERLSGDCPGADRIGAARSLARRSGAVVLLKGPATVVAGPDGKVLISRSGDERLASAGTGDVLAGIIGAHCAMGMPALRAAAAAAFVHGAAATINHRRGLMAHDLVDRLPMVLDRAEEV